MLWPEDLLGHCHRLLIQWFRLRILALLGVDEGEGVEAGSNMDMMRAKGFFTDSQGALVECFRVHKSLLRSIEFGEVVQTGGNTGVRGL